MKAASLPNLNRETTSFPNFFTLYQDVDHDEDMTLNERPNIDHGDDTEASETSPFNDILSLSLSLSPLVSSNEIGFLGAPRSVRMFRCESEHSTSSVGSNQFSCDSGGGARSEGTNPTQMDYYQQPQMSDSRIRLQILKQLELQRQSFLKLQQQQRQALLDQQRLFLDPSQSFPRSVAPSQTLDMPQAISTSLPRAHLKLIPQQISGTNSQQNLISFSHPSQQPKQSDFPGHVISHTPTGNQLATAGSTGAWAPAPAPPPSQFQRMLWAYTKVYIRGTVATSIDVTRYSGYEELKQGLARIFGIEGQLEDGHRVGYKLVYVDFENNVLLVGDDPWEEFVSCVSYIEILSPQEVQAMILDEDIGD